MYTQWNFSLQKQVKSQQKINTDYPVEAQRVFSSTLIVTPYWKDLTARLYIATSVCPVNSNKTIVSLLNPTEVYRHNKFEEEIHPGVYRGADKSLARPGRKQPRKHVREACDFNNIETRAVIKFFFSARQGAEGNSLHSGRNISFIPARAKDLSAPCINEISYILGRQLYIRNFLGHSLKMTS